jgi:hypothetical protein
LATPNRALVKVHPRVCGGAILALTIVLFARGPSPRVRGSHADANRSRRWALSHCQIVHATNLLARWAHAAATTSCHVCMADALKARCVLAEVRWRWTLKVFWAAACTERNLCADPTLLNPCIFLSLRRVG